MTMYIVADGTTNRPTGTVYTKIDTAIRQHHSNQGEVIYSSRHKPTYTIVDDEVVYDELDPDYIAAKEIQMYLEGYLDEYAENKNYKGGYYEAIALKDSSYNRVAVECRAIADCAAAIWDYMDANLASFIATGHPNLEEVKLAHPKVEEYLP